MVSGFSVSGYLPERSQSLRAKCTMKNWYPWQKN